MLKNNFPILFKWEIFKYNVGHHKIEKKSWDLNRLFILTNSATF